MRGLAANGARMKNRSPGRDDNFYGPFSILIKIGFDLPKGLGMSKGVPPMPGAIVVTAVVMVGRRDLPGMESGTVRRQGVGLSPHNLCLEHIQSQQWKGRFMCKKGANLLSVTQSGWRSQRKQMLCLAAGGVVRRTNGATPQLRTYLEPGEEGFDRPLCSLAKEGRD